ncbi:hypothetical protein GCK32_019430, partial [Trichostrongylus colubriformis]
RLSKIVTMPTDADIPEDRSAPTQQPEDQEDITDTADATSTTQSPSTTHSFKREGFGRQFDFENPITKKLSQLQNIEGVVKVAANATSSQIQYDNSKTPHFWLSLMASACTDYSQ